MLIMQNSEGTLDAMPRFSDISKGGPMKIFVQISDMFTNVSF